jgi:hypothetical protein
MSKALIYLLTGSVRIKAQAKTGSGRFTKRYVYTVLSRVLTTFISPRKVVIFLSKIH